MRFWFVWREKYCVSGAWSGKEKPASGPACYFFEGASETAKKLAEHGCDAVYRADRRIFGQAQYVDCRGLLRLRSAARAGFRGGLSVVQSGGRTEPLRDGLRVFARPSAGGRFAEVGCGDGAGLHTLQQL